MKGTLKRVMSGVLSVITIASAVAQPMTAYAAESEKAASSFEAQYPELEAVKDKLAEDEILTANDYSIDYGSDFDIKVDFSGIEGINDAKVKIELYEAKNEAGDDFDTYQADTYKTVYKVEPVSGNPSYRISRNVTVKEPETEQLTEPNTSENTVGEGNAGERKVSLMFSNTRLIFAPSFSGSNVVCVSCRQKVCGSYECTDTMMFAAASPSTVGRAIAAVPARELVAANAVYGINDVCTIFIVKPFIFHRQRHTIKHKSIQ